ncbi:Ankyrin repeat-containing domain protein [Akanthomyces lecanii RCEF 1005]|uniref:Ankyrin repeat-containing domain protein n=1 Tax=Akanthomyces lecanii RCEF 1005 TaxID=1081108 RepID=A0A162MQ55_CORDF|nr:Ankyrin repeat-containing domain protein [Akanthomyces lecanii RCEF 1005]
MSEPSTEEYTIGWVCALQEEYQAACRMRDCKFGGPETSAINDNNTYAFGRVGGHNVVIGCLPDGRYGNNSAAGVATDMVRSFPNLRVALMVGIGGGAPTPERDIRLGDVVVSRPQGTLGGVVQYDLGKRLSDGRFKRTGQLDAPPPLLLGAIPEMRRRQEDPTEPDGIYTNLKRMEDMPAFQKPSEDHLYRAEYEHRGGESCANCEADRLEQRPLRESSRAVIVHYGTIASANSVMKNAKERDKYATDPELNVLCFEMEAGGLMNTFPCLVIRGICDYSDSHKNDHWHNYAALTAAAYARELLHVLKPVRVTTLQPWAGRLESTLSDLRARTDQIIRYHHSDEERTILEWLTPFNYSLEQRNHFKKQQLGTGQWLLDSDEFLAWVGTEGQTLFCPGIPGAGKTVLTSIVVNNLCTRFQTETNIGIAYIYCDFRRKEEQNADHLLASLLKQLSQGKSSLPPSVKDLYDRHKNRQTLPSWDETSTTLQSVGSSCSKVFLIVDALDECQVSEGCRERFLSELFSLQRNCAANIFATSRFLLAQIYLRSLNKPTAKAIKATLKGFRERKSGSSESERLQVLMSAYDETMERINRQEPIWKELAMQVLSWITCAKRPLTASELQCALAVEIAESDLDTENLPQIEDMVSVCAGLVAVDDESDIIRVVHHTTQEYFDRKRNEDDWFSDVQSEMMEICVTYLSFDEFKSGPCQTDDGFELRLKSYQFYHYAANNWGHHARQASTLCQAVIEFLEREVKLEASVQALMAVKGWSAHSGYSQDVSRQITGLHLAAYFGIEEAVRTLLRKKVNVEPKDSKYGQTPLSWAVRNGHDKAVKLLLDMGKANINSRDRIGRTPLIWASENGHDAVAKLLLVTGKANVDSEDNYGRTPLSWAAANGHDAVVKLLLDTGKANVDSKDSYVRTPLSWAAENGHEAVVKLLLDTGQADITSKDGNGQTPLSWAAANGCDTVVKMLLHRSYADIECNDIYSRTPLSWAAANGHDGVVKLLLEIGKANVESKDTNGQALLSWAAWKGHNDSYCMTPRAPYKKIQYGLTPLAWAARNGHDAVVKLLIDIGKANVEPLDSNNQTALSWAAANGHDVVVKLLLDTGKVDIESKDIESRTPLSWAAENGHDVVVKLLLDTGKVDIESKYVVSWSPLLSAAGNVHINSHDRMVSPWLTNFRYGRTPLSRAAENGHDAVVKLLLDTGKANVDSKDSYGRTPLSWAAENGHDVIVKLLLDTAKADIKSKDVVKLLDAAYT